MIHYEFNNLTPEEFNQMYTSVGWHILPEEQIKTFLANSEYLITAKDDDRLIGVARLFGDGTYIYELIDVVIEPTYQMQGISKQMMTQLFNKLKQEKNPDWVIVVDVMSAKGKECFYEAVSFAIRPNDHHGSGLSMIIK